MLVCSMNLYEKQSLPVDGHTIAELVSSDLGAIASYEPALLCQLGSKVINYELYMSIKRSTR